MIVGVPQLYTHVAEFLERDLSISVFVGIEDGLVDNLLQLFLREVVAHHGLEHLEQLSITDEPILVDVVDPERNCGGRGGGEGEIELLIHLTRGCCSDPI